AEAEQDDDRRTNIHEKLVQQSEALADSERAATTRDRSQRRALGKLRTELEQHEEEEQRAWTRMRDLEQQLERQATDIVARIDASNAELEQRHQQMEQELASAESERARIGERLEHVSDALRVMTFERDELTRQV